MTHITTIHNLVRIPEGRMTYNKVQDKHLKFMKDE